MNACLSHLRRKKVRNTQSLDQPVRGGGDVGDMDGGGFGLPGFAAIPAGLRSREPLPGASVEQGQSQRLVLEALDRLDSDSRAILVLRDVQDLDYEQLAEALELPVGTVKSRLFRARAALRDAVKILNERHGNS
jgi:RNA polymerase sigma-70 factor (ECF subfamily)